MTMWRRAILGLVGCGALLVGTAVAADHAFPPDLRHLKPSILVEDRHGAFLRAFMTPDGQWRLAAEPDQVSANYLTLLIDVEDKRFWRHPGVDPIALFRATGQLLTHGHVVSGGSTLTMQVVRLLEPRRRTFAAKLIEILRAVQLEAHLSKPEILRAYLTLTPMGGNLEGVRAGSLAWFGKEPRSLSDAEAALLVALPQAPRALRPDAAPARAVLARERILRLAARDGVIDAPGLQAALAAPLPGLRRRLPRLAPHLAERLAAADPDAAQPIRTALDATTQTSVERVLAQALDEMPRPINVAAIVADWHTGEILARAGSGRYEDATRSGAIDMTAVVRSPGSTLKPFIYGMAFDGLIAHPDSLVRDGPTRFEDYAPHDFNAGFTGDVTIRQALQASLNLPAVVTLQKLGPIAFAARFRQIGLPLVFNDASVAPSLPMALGGVGMTLERLVTAYAAIADGGAVKPLIERFGVPRGEATGSVFGRAAADAVVDILIGMRQPRSGGARTGRLAYKTGTSYRFRDGWAVGFDGRRVIGVWMGRADGGTCVACVGATSAGILFRLFDTLAPAPLAPPVLTPLFAGPPPPALARLTPLAVTQAGAPHIAFPLDGAHLLVDAASPDIKLAVEGGHRPFHWIVDGRAVDSSAFAHEARWHPPGEGFAKVTVVDGLGRSDEVSVRIVARAGTGD